MAKVIHKIKVEVAKPNFFQAIVAKQFDNGSRFLNVTFVNGEEKIEIAKGSTVTINATRSDGGEKKFAGSVNADGTATVPLAYWMLELEGKVKSDISVTDTSGNTLTTTSFNIEVERASCGDSGVSEDDEEVDVLIGLIKEVQNVKENYDVEQTYNPTSTKAQSGIAVAEGIGQLGFEYDTSNFEPVNILEGVSYTEQENTIWGKTGIVKDSTNQYTSISKLFDVVEGATYLIPSYAGVVALYDENGENYERKEFITYPYPDATFVIPNGKTKMGISYLGEKRPFLKQIFRTTPTDDDKKNFPIKNKKLVLLPENLNGLGVGGYSPLANKTIVNFGDSIFGNARPPEDISTFISEETGATVYNCGFGGCRMSEHQLAGYDAFSMFELADAITTRNFTQQENALKESVPTYFSETLELLKSIDFSNVDIITIAYGTNDWGGYNKSGAKNLDRPENRLDTSTLMGALRYSVEKIFEKYPQIRIFICCPTYRANLESGTYDFIEDTDTWVKGGYKLLDCINQEREVAIEYKLPFIDNYNIGINKFNRLYYFPKTDGTHQNINGRKLIAEHISACLITPPSPQICSGSSGVSNETLNQIEAQLDEIIETQNSYIGGSE